MSNQSPRTARPGRTRITTALVAGLALGVVLGVAKRPAFAADCNPFTVTPWIIDGDDALGTGETFESTDRPNISESGHVVFAGSLTGPFSVDDVLYVNDQLIAREGDLIPGLTVPARFGQFEFFETSHQINASGDVVFIASVLDVPPDTDRAIFRGRTIVARTGEALPSIPGRTIEDIGFVGITDDGRVGFLADLDGDPDDDSVIVLGDEIIYREGDPVPGRPGVFFDGNFDEIQWNGAGDLITEANTSLPPAHDMLLLRRRVRGETVLEDIVLEEGQLIETLQGQFQLETIRQTALAEDGSWGMRGTLDTIFPSNDAIILTEIGFVAQQGDPVNELPNAVLGDFNGLDLNSPGHVLFLADVSAPAGLGLIDEGIFLNGCLVITDGVPAPDIDGDPIISDLGFEDLAINDVGQIVFHMAYQQGDGLFRLDVGKKTPCPGDANLDGAVDFVDITTVLADAGPCDPAHPCLADFNGDGLVDFSDLLVVLANWGLCI